MSSSLDIIIVNWNSGQQLADCLKSLLTADLAGIDLQRIVVVDNASQDSSVEGLDILGLPLTIIQNKKNLGFGAACNQGAQESTADYLLFLNPDTCLFTESLVKPVAFMNQPDNGSIGIVGIQLIDGQAVVSRTCARYPTPARLLSKIFGLDRLMPSLALNHFMVEWDHKANREVDQVIGAFFLVRRSLFKSLGGFDERFFVYFEEVDFSYRACKAGWRSFYLSSAQAYHKGGGTSEQVKATRLFYSLCSRIQYGYKHFGWIKASILLLGTLFIEPISRVVLAVSRLSINGVSETIDGYLMLWRFTPKLMRSIFNEHTFI